MAKGKTNWGPWWGEGGGLHSVARSPEPNRVLATEWCPARGSAEEQDS